MPLGRPSQARALSGPAHGNLTAATHRAPSKTNPAPLHAPRDTTRSRRHSNQASHERQSRCSPSTRLKHGLNAGGGQVARAAGSQPPCANSIPASHTPRRIARRASHTKYSRHPVERSAYAPSAAAWHSEEHASSEQKSASPAGSAAAAVRGGGQAWLQAGTRHGVTATSSPPLQCSARRHSCEGSGYSPSGKPAHTGS